MPEPVEPIVLDGLTHPISPDDIHYFYKQSGDMDARLNFEPEVPKPVVAVQKEKKVKPYR